MCRGLLWESIQGGGGGAFSYFYHKRLYFAKYFSFFSLLTTFFLLMLSFLFILVSSLLFNVRPCIFIPCIFSFIYFILANDDDENGGGAYPPRLCPLEVMCPTVYPCHLRLYVYSVPVPRSIITIQLYVGVNRKKGKS